jgi:hypothetical protein
MWLDAAKDTFCKWSAPKGLSKKNGVSLLPSATQVSLFLSETSAFFFFFIFQLKLLPVALFTE